MGYHCSYRACHYGSFSLVLLQCQFILWHCSFPSFFPRQTRMRIRRAARTRFAPCRSKELMDISHAYFCCPVCFSPPPPSPSFFTASYSSHVPHDSRHQYPCWHVLL